MGPIPHSYAIGEKKSGGGMPMEGRICLLSDNLDGAKAKEVLLQYSDAEKSLTFEVTSINVPAIVPIKRNVVQMSAQAIGTKSTRVTWVARPEPKLLAYPLYP
ncbi:hypothetical protein JQC92_04030 [Shewanella sp. 202IG2-18]|uniref:hypothetical protein n=1 Tax=Parashewanella hymeniacidonis TaxID=2807618 RepID=UPI0019607F93|nr:hypothetical protein [Parashewanella hymeniacidonis]MBM7071211.1 hypothetical protein [Parashewanella hymeniacidonis]